MSNEDFATEIASVIEANIKNRTYPYGAPFLPKGNYPKNFLQIATSSELPLKN
ncbi:hypothetical protein Rumi2_16480 [[Ruminococcus] torques]|uniref:hypothetical protein n=1 Tax=[Ruminococcus] torques TaxID=33039 RepID=UPI0029558FAB|nr:hypothetical protein [[Ruminococcus] torques]BEI75345.1 hypothetical protein Rumi1_11430 [[Ruminococcus] torques]BEI78488.1 hypothetical protein Rumi2_16480 [[Ruminococcus] torques]